MSNACRCCIVALAFATFAGCKSSGLREVDATPTTLNELDFGMLPVGSRKVVAVPVQNLGAAPLTLSSVVASAPFSVDAAPPDTISSGAQGYVMVAFEPLAAGEMTDTLLLTTSSIDIPSLHVALRGSAFEANLTASPARLDFGDVAVGSSRTLPVLLTNPTPARLSPSVVRAGSTDFAAAPIGALANLDANQQTTIEVTFAPTAKGVASGALTFDCATCPSRSVELAGNAIGGATSADGGTPGGPDGGATPGCSLALSPGRIDFGAVSPGGAANGTVALHSVGSAGCVVARPFFDSSSDPAFSSPSLAQLQLQPGASTSIRVDLAPGPSTPALISGALVFSSNDPQRPTQRVALSAAVPGSAAAGKLAVAPLSLSFTAQAGQALAPQEVTLSNTGGAALAWTATSDDPAISLSAARGSLAASGLSALRVTVAPQSAVGARVQHLVVDAGAAGKAVVQIGISISPSPVTDPARLVVLPTSLSFRAAPGSAPGAQAVTVLNAGAGQALTWSAAPDDGAISVAPGGGTLPGGGSRSVLISVAAQATAGVRTQQILFSAGAAGSVRVTVRIEFTSATTSPPYGSSAWPKFHQGNALNGLSTVDTPGTCGRVRWRAFVGPPAPCLKNAQTGGLTRCGTYVASPVLGTDGTVYQLGGDGKLRAFDRADGSLKWATMTAPPSLSPQESTPTVVADGSIFLGAGAGQTGRARFWHLDQNGAPIWSSACSGGVCPGWSSSPAVSSDGALWLANAAEGTVDAIDPTGRAMHKINLSPGMPLQTMSGALAADGTGYWTGSGNLFVTSAAGLIGAFSSPQEIADPLYPRTAAPTLTQDGLALYAYQWANGGGVYSTRLYAFQMGQPPDHEYWHLDLPRTKGVPGLSAGALLTAAEQADAVNWRSGITSPAVGADGTIYVGHLDGIYAVRNTDTGAVQHGRVAWSLRTAQVVSSPAVSADGHVFFGSTDGYLYNVKDGALVWQVKTSGQLNSSPAIGADGTVFAVSDDGWLYAVR